MLVRDWMSKTVITVDGNDSMQDAMKLLKQHDIEMLPVLKKGKLVGFQGTFQHLSGSLWGRTGNIFERLMIVCPPSRKESFLLAK